MIHKSYNEYLSVSENNSKPQITLSYNWLSELGFLLNKDIKLEATPGQIIIYIPEIPKPMKHPYDFNGQPLEIYQRLMRVHRWVRACKDKKVQGFIEDWDISFYITSILYEFIDILIQNKLFKENL